jgi:hypothetical protein
MYGSDIVVRELQDLAQRIADNIARNGQTASGKTARSLEVREGSDEVALLGRKAFGTMETGRRGGRVPRNFPAILYQWSLDKGISFDTDRERRSFAFLLARKIQNEGTQLFRDGGRADVYSNEIPKTINTIARKLADEVVLNFETIKLNRK